jgi:catechol 2,3-dioxygenase-like lactoylglutathione lyase family enzyme
VIGRMSHIALTSRNLERSVRFYTEVLGMKVSAMEEVPEADTKVAFLRLGGVEIEISCAKGREGDGYADRKLAHFPHLAFETDDVAAEMKNLARMGVKFDNAEPQYVFQDKVCYNTFPGPDGETLEICRRVK